MEDDRVCLFEVAVDFVFSCPEFGIDGIIFLVNANGIAISAEGIGNLVHFFRDHSQIEAVGTGLVIVIINILLFLWLFVNGIARLS